MDLSTTYLGLKLRTPLVPSASPLSDNINQIKRLEEAGASAIVLRSLFEEQLIHENGELQYHLNDHKDVFSEAQTFFPEPEDFLIGPDAYLKLVSDAKASVDIPIIGSLNCTSVGGWINYAKQIQEAGADAIELNVYMIPTDMKITSSVIEQATIDILQAVKSKVTIPVAIKLSPFYSSFTNLAKRLEEAGAGGLVLFNRFYQPDINLENLEIHPKVFLSTSQAIHLPLTWIGILRGRIRANLAATSGIHTEKDVCKLLMVGADITMLCSVLLKEGINHLKTIEKQLVNWLEENEYESVAQLKGSMSQKNCPDPRAFDRIQYIKGLSSSQFI